MSVDHDNATISGVAFSKPFLGDGNMGNMALNMGIDKQLPIGTHPSEKSTSGTAVVSDGDMEGTEDLEIGLVVNNSKRRRSLHGLHHGYPRGFFPFGEGTGIILYSIFYSGIGQG